MRTLETFDWDETRILLINRRTHKVSIRDESEFHQSVYIEPVDLVEPKKQEDEET